MGASVFKCNYGMSNTGIGCVPIWRVTRKLILVPTWASDGTLNSIDTTQTLDKTYFDGFINNADLSKRWFPLPFMKNATNTRAESLKETFDDQSVNIIQQGVRKMVAKITEKDATPQLLGAIKMGRQIDMSVFLLDNDHSIVGKQGEEANKLYPIRLDSNSLDPLYNPSTDKTTQVIDLMFDFHISEMDEDIRMITINEMDYDPTLLNGLLDITAIFTNPLHAGTFTVQLNTMFGTMINPLTDKGLVKADFVLKNITTNATITITTVTEKLDSITGQPTGVYDFVFPAQTASDVVQLIPTKAGRDYSQVSAVRTVLV